MTQTTSSAMTFIIDYLRRESDAPYKAVQAAAKESGHTIYPVMYGRAKAILGLIPVKKRGTASPGPKPRGRRAGRTILKLESLEDLKGFLDSFKKVQTERDGYREALESIVASARRVLG
ncbi:MAG TPA: hypothetical protein VFI25_06655 [Planctomycetota bacterium]|jgi:CBS domain containing-hemolysin-like protein|nr:hypothetical protein [Planctomycetota bacterium]